MASGGSEHASDEIFNFKCSPCLDDKRNREAAKYCVECQGYYCQSCADMFHKMPGLKSHTFLDQTNYKSSSGIGGLPAIPTQRCSVHKTKIVDMYCGNHDEVGCKTCIALGHRSCSDVKSIPDIVDKAHSTKDIKKLDKELKDVKRLKEKLIDTKRAQREDLKKSKFDSIREIKTYRQEVDAILDNIEENSIAEVEKIFQEVDSELFKENTITEDEIDQLEQSLKDLKQSEGNKAQQFVSMKTSALYISKMNDETIPDKFPVLRQGLLSFFEPTI
ncbi:probable E3 ubiquitin-protein ligase MID2 [Ruditapes philippinarum]|uniref:probable E3 ubiquitin-protein ligase MID2 n=1 Tax=Ruditapes philippinarum TaxID=129788 RepID=UPI00295ADE5C|nr:probable E3 ubiquitin-protein ligase MID2 [Ruditapes philippinarum]